MTLVSQVSWASGPSRSVTTIGSVVAANGTAEDGGSQVARTRRKILDAARGVFARSGYRGGRTVDVATLAGVTERTLFRYFPSKAELFTVAVVEPFHDYVAAFVRDWNEREHGVRSAHEETRLFYGGLLDMLDEHRGLMVALVAARAFDDPDGRVFPRLGSELAELLGTAEPTMRVESETRGFRGLPSINVRLMFGLAITMSLHGDWLFTPNDRPDRETLLDELTAFTLNGLGSSEDSRS
jgi:AcrR family transcriptional regulator